MAQQISVLGQVGGHRVHGWYATDNPAVRAAYIDRADHTNLSGREMMALGHMLQELGAAMLGGDLKKSADEPAELLGLEKWHRRGSWENR